MELQTGKRQEILEEKKNNERIKLMELYLLVILPIFAAILLYLLPSKFTTILIAIVYICMILKSMQLFYYNRFLNQIVISNIGGEGILGINLYCDLTASVFLILITFLFFCVFIYTVVREKTNKLFTFLITSLESLIILIFLSRDIFNIYVAVEVSTIICSILIMFKRDSRSIYDGLVYLLSNIVGMIFFLLGIGMLYRQFGVLDISALKELIALCDKKELILPYCLIMTGVCLKCALVPVHSWLPYAHGTPGAPTAVSAILSGLYVKGGIYLFIRIREMFMPSLNLDWFFLIMGIITSIAGIMMAVSQKDIKLILAYHTISQLGLIIVGISVDNKYGMAGAMLHIINHAMFKSLLFLTAGILITKYKTRNVYEIRGVIKSMPLVGIAIAAGILGITGAPFFNGSISKYFIQSGVESFIVEIFLIIINFGTVLSFVKFGQVLFGTKQKIEFKYDIYSTAVVIVLAVLCLATGVLGSQFVYFIFKIDLNIDVKGYILKSLMWAANFYIGWLVYHNIISKNKKLKQGIDFSLSFNTICLCTVSMFLIILGASYISA